MTARTVDELRSELRGWSSTLPFRIEDQDGKVLGTAVTDVYRHVVDIGEEIVIAICKDADEPPSVAGDGGEW